MTRTTCLAAILLSLTASVAIAQDMRVASRTAPRVAPSETDGHLDALIAKHSAAYGVPEDLVRRVIHRESRGNPRAISMGNYGLMQIRIGTARAMGYRGSIEGLLDADTNMTYAVKYLAGAYRVAGGNADRAVAYYAAGYAGKLDPQTLAAPGEKVASNDSTGTLVSAAAARSTNPP